MTRKEIRRYQMLVRVREFANVHRDRFPASGPAAELWAVVSKAVDELGTHNSTQASGAGASRGGAMTKAAARETLNRAVDAVIQTAQALDTPGLGAKFYLPHNRSDHDLATAAGRLVTEVAPLKAQFVAFGMPKTFLADLQSALDVFQRATQDRLAAGEANAAAAAGIAAAMDVALAAVSRLDAVVANTLRDEPMLLAVWTKARHVPGGRRAGADREPAAPAATSPVPPDTVPVKEGQAA